MTLVGKVPRPRTVHWADPSLCGKAVLAKDAACEDVNIVTCEDCIVRVFAQLHHDMGVLMKTLVQRLVILRDVAERSVARD